MDEAQIIVVEYGVEPRPAVDENKRALDTVFLEEFIENHLFKCGDTAVKDAYVQNSLVAGSTAA